MGRADKIVPPPPPKPTNHSLTGRLTLFLSAALWNGRTRWGSTETLLDSRVPAPPPSSGPSGYYRIYSIFILLIPCRPPASDWSANRLSFHPEHGEGALEMVAQKIRAIHKGRSLFSCSQMKILFRQIKSGLQCSATLHSVPPAVKFKSLGMQKGALMGGMCVIRGMLKWLGIH